MCIKKEGQTGWDRRKPIGMGGCAQTDLCTHTCMFTIHEMTKQKIYESKLQSCKHALQEQMFANFLWNRISYLYINISDKLLVKLVSKSHFFLISLSAALVGGALFCCVSPEKENGSVAPGCLVEVDAVGASRLSCKEINSGIAAVQKPLAVTCVKKKKTFLSKINAVPKENAGTKKKNDQNTWPL